MDCPHCQQMLAQMAGRKKHERLPYERKFRGGVNTKYYGDTRGHSDIGLAAPVGAMKIDACCSCGWHSVWRYDGPAYPSSKGPVTTWRLIECGTNVNVKGHLGRYGFK